MELRLTSDTCGINRFGPFALSGLSLVELVSQAVGLGYHLSTLRAEVGRDQPSNLPYRVGLPQDLVTLAPLIYCRH
jgi:hypothetical protein